MVNCNPETVSTDYDTSDRLYFEPVTFEDVMNIVETEKPDGVIVQYGGQTPLKLAKALTEAGVPIIGTSADDIDRAEDREIFSALLNKLNLKQPVNGTAKSLKEAIDAADRIGYPVVVRPSYVLGGRGMEIVYDATSLAHYMIEAVSVSPEHPVLIDSYLDGAIEVDVDCISDGKKVIVAGVMEHIEEAGIHSGDSACCLPPHSLPERIISSIKDQTRQMALALNVVGLMNVQFAVKGDAIYVLEVNPRASRTVPFVSKATGVPFAKLGAKTMVGKSLKDLGLIKEIIPKHVSIKEAVFPFSKFPGSDVVLGPEMKSTGEVMGIASKFGAAFAKGQISAFNSIPLDGTIFLSVRNEDKEEILETARRLDKLGFKMVATKGTAQFLTERGLKVPSINKVREGSPHVVEAIMNGDIAGIINTPEGRGPNLDSRSIRLSALSTGTPYFTTASAAEAAVQAIEEMKKSGLEVRSLQEFHQELS